MVGGRPRAGASLEALASTVRGLVARCETLERLGMQAQERARKQLESIQVEVDSLKVVQGGETRIDKLERAGSLQLAGIQLKRKAVAMPRNGGLPVFAKEGFGVVATDVKKASADAEVEGRLLARLREQHVAGVTVTEEDLASFYLDGVEDEIRTEEQLTRKMEYVQKVIHGLIVRQAIVQAQDPSMSKEGLRPELRVLFRGRCSRVVRGRRCCCAPGWWVGGAGA